MSQADELQAILALTREAQEAWINGDASGYQRLFESGSHPCYMGPFGGTPGLGHAEIAERMATTVRHFDGGACSIELVSNTFVDNVAILILMERNTVLVHGRDQPVRWLLRVTQCYRKGAQGWRIFHRHADPLSRLRPMSETLALLD
jgi:ketosteroid isomerase-like protein